MNTRLPPHAADRATAHPTLVAAAHQLAAALEAVTPTASTIAVALHHQGHRALAVRGRTRHHGGHPADVATRFEIGSLTKTFTALLFAEQAARGELGHHDPAARHLHTAPRGGDALTLTHLATHTSGLPRLPPGLLRRAAPHLRTNPYAHFTPDDAIRRFTRTRLRAAPGTRVRYSNFGIGLLGHALVSAADGTPYSTLLHTRLSAPLALCDTDCATDPPPGATQATGHRHHRPLPAFHIPGLPAAGALRSSARDLLTFTEALLDPAAAPGPASLRTALRDVLRPRLRLPSGDGLSLVWNTRPRDDGSLLYHHSGGTVGFTAFTGFNPQHRTALTALANTGPTHRSRFIQQAYTALTRLPRLPDPIVSCRP